MNFVEWPNLVLKYTISSQALPYSTQMFRPWNTQTDQLVASQAGAVLKIADKLLAML